jgi:hypothetical protein
MTMKRLSCSKHVAAPALAALLFSFCHVCGASPLTLSSPVFSNGFTEASAGPASPSDAVPPFRFGDAITASGDHRLPETPTPSDAVAESAALSTSAGLPLAFGDEIFVLDPSTSIALPYEEVAPARVVGAEESAAERGRLLMVGAGILVIFTLATLSSRSGNIEKAPPVPVRKPIAGKAWVQRGTTFRISAPEDRAGSLPAEA